MPKMNTSEDLKKGVKSKSPFLELPKGETKVLLLSPIYGVREHEIEVNGKYATIICPIEMERWDAESEEREVGEVKCPVCEAGNRTTKTRFMAEAITDEGDVGVIKKGSKVFGPILANRDAGWDLMETWFVIKREGEKLGTDYAVGIVKNGRSLTEEDNQEITLFRETFEIEKRTKPMSYENIAKKMKGEPVEFNEEE